MAPHAQKAPQEPWFARREDRDHWKVNQVAKKQEEDEKKIERLEKAKKGADLFRKVQTHVTEKVHRLGDAAERIGKAYRNAATNHTEAISKDNTKKQQVQALETQLIFSCLAIASAGACSWVTESVLLDNAQNPMTVNRIDQLYKVSDSMPKEFKGAMDSLANRLKTDLPRALSMRELWTKTLGATISAGLGEVFSAIGPTLPSSKDPPPPTQPANQDPANFETDLKTQVHKVAEPALAALTKMADKMDDLPLEAWDKFDLSEFQAAFQKFQDDSNQLADVDDLPDEKPMTDDLERFLWAVWIPRLHYTEVHPNTGAFDDVEFTDVEEEVYYRVRDNVDNRFVALKIETQADTDLPRKEEDTKLIAWSKDYLRNGWKPWALKVKAQLTQGSGN